MGAGGEGADGDGRLCTRAACERPLGTFHVPGSSRKVGVYVTVFHIGEISTVLQSFDVEMVVNCSWLPTEEELARFKEEGHASFTPDFFPRFDIVNAEETPEWSYNQYQGRDFLFADRAQFELQGFKNVKYQWALMCQAKVKVHCRADFDMHSFPFDIQDLPIVLESGRIELSHLVPSLVNHRLLKLDLAGVSQDEWEFKDIYLEFQYTEVHDSITGNQYSRVYLNFKIRRYWTMYFWRDCFFLMCTSFSSLGTFTLNREENYNDRLNFVVALLITMSGVNYVVQSSAPPVSYLTIMQKFVIGSFSYVFLMGMACVTSELIGASEDLDKMIGFGCLGAWILFHVSFMVYALRNFFYEQAKLMRTKTELIQERRGKKKKAACALFVDDSGSTRRHSMAGIPLWSLGDTRVATSEGEADALLTGTGKE